MDFVSQHNTGTSRPLVGRDGMLRNVMWRLGRHESLVVFGGPKLGKSSFLLDLNQRLDRDAMTSRYLDLDNADDQEMLLAVVPDPPIGIYLLDNCDALCEKKGTIRDFLSHSSGLRVVMAGGRRWHDEVSVNGWASELRRIPLAVLLDKDARQLVCASHLNEQVESILALAGTHPYVLNVLCAQDRDFNADADVAAVWSEVSEMLAPFFLNVVQQLKTPIEHRLLHYLVRLAAPVNPQIAAEALEQTTLKAVADMLSWLGVISRCIRNDEATLFANSALFNLWYVEHVAGRS
ncbi:MAG TPA: hypothetical protein EYG58_02190 [Nitrospirales bacterium]|nr:hypothetical protein [Nitrospirales bacterium]HIO69341.1 hypothetical protein [Nitrospirales bacterium]